MTSRLSRTFSRTAMRLTGKKTNPHLIRDIVITHVRGGRRREGEERHARYALAQQVQVEVTLTEARPPLRDAMSFVDRNEQQLACLVESSQ